MDDLQKLNNLDEKPVAVAKPSPIPNLSLSLVDIYRIDGEILTQLGLRPHDIPFLIGAMKVLGTGLPRPQGNVIVMDPIVPPIEQKDRTNPAQQDLPHFIPTGDSEKKQDRQVLQTTFLCGISMGQEQQLRAVPPIWKNQIFILVRCIHQSFR